MLRKSNTQYLGNSVLFLPLFSCIHVNAVESHQTPLVVNRFSFGCLLKLGDFHVYRNREIDTELFY